MEKRYFFEAVFFWTKNKTRVLTLKLWEKVAFTFSDEKEQNKIKSGTVDVLAEGKRVVENHSLKISAFSFDGFELLKTWNRRESEMKNFT